MNPKPNTKNIYVIGDVQGCFHTFLKLYEQIPKGSPIYFAGDVTNRGPCTLEMLRWLYQHQNQCKIVLGNHDIHAMAVILGVRHSGQKDTLNDFKNAPDRFELVKFLSQQPLMIEHNHVCISHAGLHPFLSTRLQLNLAEEFSKQLAQNPQEFLQHMFAHHPTLWHDDLSFHEKMRFILNISTRMRYIHEKTGELEFKHKNLEPPKYYIPWFKAYQKVKKRHTVIFGHWSHQGLRMHKKYIGLDTGCVWGGMLTAIKIASQQPSQLKNHQLIQQKNCEKF
jgi:bis(5'-nucleosyl)-tetraphosphatase (symmetrical)